MAIPVDSYPALTTPSSLPEGPQGAGTQLQPEAGGPAGGGTPQGDDEFRLPEGLDPAVVSHVQGLQSRLARASQAEDQLNNLVGNPDVLTAFTNMVRESNGLPPLSAAQQRAAQQAAQQQGASPAVDSLADTIIRAVSPRLSGIPNEEDRNDIASAIAEGVRAAAGVIQQQTRDSMMGELQPYIRQSQTAWVPQARAAVEQVFGQGFVDKNRAGIMQTIQRMESDPAFAFQVASHFFGRDAYAKRHTAQSEAAARATLQGYPPGASHQRGGSVTLPSGRIDTRDKTPLEILTLAKQQVAAGRHR